MNGDQPRARLGEPWEPPLKFEERLKALVPPAARIAYLHRKRLRKGEAELRLVAFLADRARVSIDVGANQGVYAYALLPHSRQVHAFEPNPKLFRMLRAWAKARTGVVLHAEALGDVSGPADLLVPMGGRGFSNQGASLSAVKVSGEHRKLTVQAARLDDLGIEGVGFIKIDVEGFELQVLAGAAATLARDRPNLLVEMEERHTGRPLPQMVAAVTAHGYDALALVDGVLTPFARLDLARHHGDPWSEHYVNNLIFLPR
ncbi:FkbM family methyltransferase [Phenylobacterium sp.]|jgi:FkbM family methyltransferase|uniref:FkbM family methyltransferase n=1 Tax=Phenylobacterium sp. TaxID=1871053 RepID=UPI002F428ED8